MDVNKTYLSVVIPAYNEEGRIGTTLASIRSYLRAKPFASEILVVDDGSRDKTAAIAEDALRDFGGGRLIRLARNLGKGAAVKAGVLAARGELVLVTDADLSTPIDELEKFLPWFVQGFDVVLGSRAIPGADVQVRQMIVRELMGKTFNLFVRALILNGIPDTQCGFKLFRRKAAEPVFAQSRIAGFAFDVEVLFLCRRAGLKVKQVPVVWRNSPPSKVRMVRSSFQMLRDLARINRFHK